MDATREIYWNVGHGVVAVMYLLTIVAVTLAAFGFKQRLEIWRQGKSLDRFDRRGDRAQRMLATVFSQTRVFRVKDGGLFHSLFFWGFLTLFAGTILIMVQSDFLLPLFKVNLLQGEFYRYFSLVLDLAGLVAIVMLAGLFVRRFFIKPKGLETVADDYRIHALLFTILITGFLIEGSRMAVTELKQNPDLAVWSPVGYVFAQALSFVGDSALLGLHKGSGGSTSCWGSASLPLFPVRSFATSSQRAGTVSLPPLSRKARLARSILKMRALSSSVPRKLPI